VGPAHAHGVAGRCAEPAFMEAFGTGLATASRSEAFTTSNPDFTSGLVDTATDMSGAGGWAMSETRRYGTYGADFLSTLGGALTDWECAQTQDQRPGRDQQALQVGPMRSAKLEGQVKDWRLGTSDDGRYYDPFVGLFEAMGAPRTRRGTSSTRTPAGWMRGCVRSTSSPTGPGGRTTSTRWVWPWTLLRSRSTGPACRWTCRNAQRGFLQRPSTTSPSATRGCTTAGSGTAPRTASDTSSPPTSSTSTASRTTKMTVMVPTGTTRITAPLHGSVVSRSAPSSHGGVGPVGGRPVNLREPARAKGAGPAGPAPFRRCA